MPVNDSLEIGILKIKCGLSNLFNSFFIEIICVYIFWELCMPVIPFMPVLLTYNNLLNPLRYFKAPLGALAPHLRNPVINNCMFHIGVHQVNEPARQPSPMETEQPLLSPGSRRRYPQHSKRCWLILPWSRHTVGDNEVISHQMFNFSGDGKHRQLLHEWVSAEVKEQ